MKNDNPGTGKKIQQAWYSVLALFGLSKISKAMTRNLLPENHSAHIWKAGFHDCTHAYAVSLPGAKKLLAAQTPVAFRADNLLSSLILKEELKAFAVKKFLFNQEIFSDSNDPSFVRERKPV